MGEAGRNDGDGVSRPDGFSPDGEQRRRLN